MQCITKFMQYDVMHYDRLYCSAITAGKYELIRKFNTTQKILLRVDGEPRPVGLRDNKRHILLLLL